MKGRKWQVLGAVLGGYLAGCILPWLFFDPNSNLALLGQMLATAPVGILHSSGAIGGELSVFVVVVMAGIVLGVTALAQHPRRRGLLPWGVFLVTLLWTALGATLILALLTV